MCSFSLQDYDEIHKLNDTGELRCMLKNFTVGFFQTTISSQASFLVSFGLCFNDFISDFISHVCTCGDWVRAF